MARGNPNLSFGTPGPGTSSPHTPQYKTLARPILPFLATLKLSDLSKLGNDPMCHNVMLPPVLIKLPSYIPKFEWKIGEDPGDHATTFHF